MMTYFNTWSSDFGIYSPCSSIQSFILRFERGNRGTEHLGCHKIELSQNYHDLVSFSVIALIGFRCINVNTDCL